ncbi:MAG: inorganic pyrophosphatase Ppa [Chrysiogenales bacterium]|nr:MAG: inorganic pyrophosphatase Ppa [Chrysiogenales bacterium]
MPEQYIKKLIEMSNSRFDIEKYHTVDIRLTHRDFEGTPQKHPYDEKLLILLSDPFSNNRDYLELTLESIGKIEEIGTLTDEDGNSAIRVRVWIKKGTPAIRSKPFIIK